MSAYLHGCDVIVGASIAPVSSRALLIKVRDVPALVAAQGGSAGQLFDQLLPDTIEAKVYSDMRAEFAKGLRDKGVAADVSIVTPVGYQKAPTPDLARGAFMGAGAVGISLLMWHFFKKGK